MDSTLTRYLLGDLPQPQMDALDERSIVDAEFAEQLRATGHDLADAYARGELSPEDRAKWERGLGASSEGREQVRIARALWLREQAQPPSATAASGFPTYWALAAAAAIVFAAGSLYVLRNGRERDQPAPSAQSAPAPGAAAPSPSSFVAVTLPIPTRSAADPPVLAIPPGTQRARITLRLEPSEFTKFSLALLDLETKRVVWRANNLAAETGTDGRALTADVPADVLRAGRAIFQVMGVTDAGSELVGMYPLTIQRKT